MIDRPIPLSDIVGIAWRRKWLLLLCIFSFSSVGVIYSLAAQEYFRAEAVLAPAEKRSNMGSLGQLSGLASLAGISVGAGGSAESLAMLRSRQFVGSVVAEQQLLSGLFPEKWDEKRKRWDVEDEKDVPTDHDGAGRFIEDRLVISEDKKTGIVRLAVVWTDPDTASRLANLLVTRLNVTLRDRAISDSERNIAYLQEELERTQVVSLQQSIGRLVDTELQKLMLARGNKEFAFKVVDPAVAPRDRDRPNRVLITLVSSVLGGLFGMILLLWLHFRSERWSGGRGV
jgi:uncharacterized protein involved in exopolysaccharide biosynthesis